MTDLTSLATELTQLGIVTIPVGVGKLPIGPWHHRIAGQLPTVDELDNPPDGTVALGAVCGAASGNLELLEFEAVAVAEGVYAQFRDFVKTHQPDLWDALGRGWVVTSPSGGIHFWYRCREPVEGNQKIAKRNCTDAELAEAGASRASDPGVLFAETRGQGGYAVVAGGGHSSGNTWQTHPASVGPRNLPTLTGEQRRFLLDAARGFDTYAKPHRERAEVSAEPENMDKPGNIFNANTTWDDVLIHRRPEGQRWRLMFVGSDGIEYWQRPGKTPDDAHSATVNGTPTPDRLYVFTTSTALEAESSYDRFEVEAILGHGGDFNACAKTLMAEGFVADSNIEQMQAEYMDLITQRSPPLSVNDPIKSWPKGNLAGIFAGTYRPPSPTIWARPDGKAWIYRGALNSLAAASGIGKTWVGLAAGVSILAEGGTFAFVDNEDSITTFVSRMRSLGVETPDRITYRSGGPLDPADFTALVTELGNHDYVVFDGVTAMATNAGLDINSATEVDMLYMVPRAVALMGAAVLLLDHVPKNPETVGAIGSQHKQAGITGASYTMNVVEPNGIGKRGVSTLICTKDRHGSLSTGETFANVVLESDGVYGVAASLEMPDKEALVVGYTRVELLAERVSDLLIDRSIGCSKAEITATFSGAPVNAAIDRLMRSGYIYVDDDKDFFSARPYRRIRDPHSTAFTSSGGFDT